MKKLILLNVVFFAFLMQAACDSSHQQTFYESLMATVGQSHVMHTYSKHVQTKIDGFVNHKICNIGNEPAALKYQTLWKEAQLAVGIREDRHLPIKTLTQQQATSMENIAAVAESDALYIDEQYFNKTSYGVIRSTLFHEAIHVKHQDKAVTGLLRIAAWGGTLFATSKALTALQVTCWRKSLTLLSTLCLVASIMQNHIRFVERRADIQGHYATQCAICVHESALNRSLLSDDAFWSGHVRAEDLEEITQKLNNAMCTYHCAC